MGEDRTVSDYATVISLFRARPGSDYETVINLLRAIDGDGSRAAAEIAVDAIAHAEDPEMLLVAACQFALLMRAQPSMPLDALAGLLAGDQLVPTDFTLADVGLEFMDALDATADGEAFTPEGEEIIARFDRRPGSADATRMLLMAVASLLAGIQMQMAAPELVRKSPDAIIEWAKANTRSGIRGNGAISPFA